MYEVLMRVAEEFQGKHLNLVLALVLAGSLLIVVNAASHALIESHKERLRRRELVTRGLRPALAAAERLISRIADILVTHQQSMATTIKLYSLNAVHDRIPILTASSINRHESTAFRLAHFLSLTEYFIRQTANAPQFLLLERANYYLLHKIPVGLRGNLYGTPLMGTRVQEEIGSRFLECAKEANAVDLTVGKFLSLVKSTPDGPELLAALMKVFWIDTTPLATGQDLVREDENWRRMLALVHLGVYLIDFFQEFEANCRWEEERVLFVRLIAQWNADAARRRYLYEPGDLDTGNYVDTYPGRLSPPPLLTSIWIGLLERLRLHGRIERSVKWMKVNLRGARYRRRHDTKRIRRWGVGIKTPRGLRRLRWSDDIHSLYQELQAYEKTRMVDESA